jgi:hypothetical protein
LDAHWKEVKKQVAKWHKMGLIQPACRKFNSPIYSMANKNGGILLMQNFWTLNARKCPEKHNMKEIS